MGFFARAASGMALLLALSACAGSAHPPVPFDVRYFGPQAPTPAFVLRDGYAYWWFEKEKGGEVLFVNPATFEEFVLAPESGARIVIALDGTRYFVEPPGNVAQALKRYGLRGMTLDELKAAGFRRSEVEAPVGWQDRVREARAKERSRKRQIDLDRERNRVAEAAKRGEAPEGTPAQTGISTAVGAG